MKHPARTRLRLKVFLCGVTCIAATSAGTTFAEAQIQQTPKNGCSSPDAYSGALTSPSFRTFRDGPSVSGQWWFEVEGVDPHDHDLVVAEVGVPDPEFGVTIWTELGRLNPSVDPDGRADQGYSNNGLGQPPSFKPFGPFPLPLDELAVQIRFRFDSVDG